MIYRWLRKQRYVIHAALFCGIFLIFPLGVIGGTKVSQFISVNRALAATRAMTPGNEGLNALPEKKKQYYASVLGKKMLNNPDTFYHLINQDFLLVLNQPDLKRQEGDVEIWQYRTDSCVLDIYFDSSRIIKKSSVIYYEIRSRRLATMISEQPPQTRAVDHLSCLQDMITES